jgi:predicted amidohydrolase
MTGSESVLRVACLQMEPRIGDVAHNLKRTLEMIGDAAAAGAKLVVLPELCNTGYVFETREEAFRLAEEVPAGPTTEAWAQAAARHGLTLVAGITERDGAVLYNSAVGHRSARLSGPLPEESPVGRGEPLLRARQPGHAGVPHRDRPISCAICYDIWFPETFRLAALQGADILCVPTNWVPMPSSPARCR